MTSAVAFAPEDRVRQDGQLDQGVAGARAAGRALPLQAQGLALLGALGDGDVDGAAVGKGDPALAAADRVFQVDLQPGAHVGAALRKAAEAAALAAAAPAAAPPPNISPRMSPRSTPSKLSALEAPAAAAAEAAARMPRPTDRRRAKPRAVSRPSASISPASNFLRLSASPRMSKAPETRLKRSSASLLFGWCRGGLALASLRNALRISSALAPRETPSS